MLGAQPRIGPRWLPSFVLSALSACGPSVGGSEHPPPTRPVVEPLATGATRDLDDAPMQVDEAADADTAVAAASASAPSAEPVDPHEAEADSAPGPERPTIEYLEDKRHLKHRPVPMETLDQVAARYDLEVDTLRKWNDLPEDYRLEKVRKKPKLRLYATRISPPRERIEHTVAEGDTWGQLARRYGAASTDIRAYNVRELGRDLDPGEVAQIWVDPVVFAEIERGDNELGLRRGAYSIGTPNEGRLVNAVRLPDSEDYELGYPNSAWGTTFAVSAVMRAIREFRTKSGYEGRLKIGTMSRQRGGEVGNHKSHQSGRDLDIRLPLKEDVPQKLRPEPWRVDWLATWRLIEAFADGGDTLVIFFDYKLQRRIAKAAEAAGADPKRIEELLQWPVGSKASRGLVRHEPGHEQHIHVRLACGAYETECRP